ncbi:MAG: sugar porter family MFS transporter [Burkholderiaceae bacterium]
MNKGKLFQSTIVAALAGFIFGFDMVVISGADKPIQELWHTTPLFHGFFIMSMALWGTVIGSVFAGAPTEKYGRKKVLIWLGIMFIASAIGSAFAQDPYTFSFFRLIGGIAIGVSSVAAPTYISEISNKNNRGRLVGMYQFNIVFGILIAYLSNYFLAGFGGANDWRWMLAVLLIPAGIYTIMTLGLPESPRWLFSVKNDEAGARETLAIVGVENIDQTIEEIKNASNEEKMQGGLKLFTKHHSKIISIAFFVAFFNQASGINFLLYYAPRILEEAGFAKNNSLLSSISLGLMNLLFTFVGLYLIDRIGRKTLLIIGSFGYIISLSMVAYGFINHSAPEFMLSFLLLFIASHAIGQGAVIWVLISEIFPTQIRAKGQAFGASIHWVFAALITLVTPVFLDSKNGIFKDNPWPIFAFFTVMMALQLVWIIAKVPETKGVSLEELQKKLAV